MYGAEHVSDALTKEVVESWKPKSRIFVEAGTGMGKSHFIKYDLYDYAKSTNKRILMILPRTNSLKQFNEETIDKKDHISIVSYQSLESEFTEARDFYVSQFDFIVLDEAQYYLADASFNKYTDKSLDSILKTDAVIIFMTATPGKIKRFLTEVKNEKVQIYKFPVKKIINSLLFYQDDETLFEVLDEIAGLPETKAAVFCGNTQRAYEIYKQYKDDAIFECSRQNALKDKRSADDVEEMIKRQRFDKKFLISTSTLDSGFNLIDWQLSAIILDDITDVEQIIQFTGRKRQQDSSTYDTISVFVRVPRKQKLGGQLRQHQAKIEMASKFLQWGESSLRERENDKSNTIFYDPIDQKLKVNFPVYYNSVYTIEELKQMLDKKKEWTFCRIVWDALKPQLADTVKNKMFSPDVVLPTIYDKKLADFLKSALTDGKIWKGRRGMSIFYSEVNQRINGHLVRDPTDLNYLFTNRYGFPYRVEKFTLAENKKPITALRIIDASDQMADEIEKYLADCFERKKVWYFKDDRNDIIKKLCFTNKDGRILTTAKSINRELDNRQSDYRIKVYSTKQTLKDINGQSVVISCANAWKIIKAPNASIS